MGFISNYYKKTTVHRYDENGFIKYFTASDFPGLKAEPVSFMSGKNTLRGYYYSYDGARDDVLIIFCHGIGGGHRSYLTEIERIAREGYTVLAYDNTGCFESEGESTVCMSRSLSDLDSALTHLKNEGEFVRYDSVIVMGHSWGGFAAGNIANFHPDVKKAVVVSGFISVKNLFIGTLGGAKDPVRKLILWRLLAFEKKAAPKYFGYCVADTVKKKGTQYLFSHSKDDPSVPYKYNCGIIEKTADRDNVSFLIYDDKLHNPNYTFDATHYLADVFGRFAKEKKAGNLKTLELKKQFFADTDWVRMTKQDEDFWRQIFAFFEK